MAIDPVDDALGDLALSAVATLANVMHTASQNKDRIAAANSILDRLGYGRATRAQAEVADREIRNALNHAIKSASGPESKQIEDGEEPQSNNRSPIDPEPISPGDGQSPFPGQEAPPWS